MRQRLKKDLEMELSQNEIKKLTKKSSKSLKKLDSPTKNGLLEIQFSNKTRSKEMVEFVKNQMKKFKKMGSQMMANQIKYLNARKKIWMENDELNKMENQKIYEEELTAYLLRFNLIKKQINKNFKKIENQARKNASKISSKILTAEIKKWAKLLNKEYKQTLKPDYETFWEDEINIMREMDHKFEKEFKDDLKLANIAASKFA